MSRIPTGAPSRSRFENVVNVSDVPEQRNWPDSERYTSTAKEVALAIGSKELGYCVNIVPPGERSAPFHFHHSEEEVFHILEGQCLLRQGDGRGEEELIELRVGDIVAFPAGTGIAHQFINNGQRPLVYFALSNRIPSDVAEYPDSDKVSIRRTRLILRRTPALLYFDRED